MADETGWLIEANRARLPSFTRPAWLTIKVPDKTSPWGGSWTCDSVQALRFARREDAEDFQKMWGLSEVAFVSEHSWIGLHKHDTAPVSPLDAPK